MKITTDAHVSFLAEIGQGGQDRPEREKTTVNLIFE
jgi:hypothetical protein